jgi:hypothetical protein
MLQTDVARAILSVECISAVENFQVVMKEKQQYIALHVRLQVSLTRHAASTSPVELMNSHIKGTMGCSSNMYTSTSLLKWQEGAIDVSPCLIMRLNKHCKRRLLLQN